MKPEQKSPGQPPIVVPGQPVPVGPLGPANPPPPIPADEPNGVEHPARSTQ